MMYPTNKVAYYMLEVSNDIGAVLRNHPLYQVSKNFDDLYSTLVTLERRLYKDHYYEGLY